eukprot:CAMPEP_0204074508 /NCGR_PEP_ID=MMETSP0360-20130528/164908_1 /ASSEMBLY_ACC=CAM_ASM_000342 /TAXON_ID=268821 /ORGANISM="Scrippsiella Hangoei, Strain SHTV-5" /LENGTH=66 /DNA_ID=CAMNT_0051022961 /DNA_START=174 /DNA_END=374 /DNA_ORIENTATION=-
MPRDVTYGQAFMTGSVRFSTSMENAAWSWVWLPQNPSGFARYIDSQSQTSRRFSGVFSSRMLEFKM